MGDYYTLMVYREQPDGTATTAYAELIQALGPTERPRVLKVMPYHPLPRLDLPDPALPAQTLSNVE